MIEQIKFRRNVRDVFKRGAVLKMKPVTLVCGDNGSGKSTLLHYIVDAVRGNADGGEAKFMMNGVLKIKNSGSRLERFIFADFEKDNCRTQHNFDLAGPLGIFSNLSMSHGETVMGELEHDFSELKSTLILLDEPDQCLSPRSSYRVWRIFSKMAEENGCQVICSCHSVPLMESAGEVLSLEHGRWINYLDFLEDQKNPKPLRWVDSDERFCDFVVKATFSDGREMYVSSQYDSGCYSFPFNSRPLFARRFKSKEAAEAKASKLMGKKYKFRSFMEECTLTVVSAEAGTVMKEF